MCKKGYQISLAVAACIFINYFLKYVVSLVSVPFWLDSVGTAIAAYLLGPFCGAVVGGTVNIIYGFQDPMSFLYAITNAAVGIVIGVCAKKKLLENYYGMLLTASISAIVSVIISAPINILAYEGYTGNVFGDEMFLMLKEWDFPWIIAAVIVELFLDFFDKLLCLILLFGLIRWYRYNKKKKSVKVYRGILFAILSASIALTYTSSDAWAKEEEEEDYSSYIQTVYSNDNGLLSGEANSIVSTEDGVMWIGTYAGLYRYTGNDFQYMNEFRTVKNVNCLFVDAEGRLLIGTNDDGLSICIDGKIVNTLNEDDRFPSNSVRSIGQRKDGIYVVGTSDSLAFVELSSGMRIRSTVPEIVYATDIATDQDGNVAAINSYGELFILDGEKIISKMAHDERGNSFSSCEFGADGRLYAGAGKGMIKVYRITKSKPQLEDVIECDDLTEINDLAFLDSGDLFVCSDNGIGHINKSGDYEIINTGEFDNSIDHMAIDYQRNLWFSSSRLGVLKMCASSFSEVYNTVSLEKKVVNTIARWNGLLYFGTDSGLDIIDERTKKVIQNELTELLDGDRIRCVKVDSENELWICTYANGILNVKKDGNYISITEENGALGSKFRSMIELKDGTIAISSDAGISFIKDEKVVKTIGVKEGLKNSLVLSMEQVSDGTLYAGTDGGGMSVIRDYEVCNTYVREDGLGSGVILRIIKDSNNDNIFIITSNGICYKEGDTIRRLENFPYSNNYDLFDDGEGNLFVTGSAGIYVVNKEQLLAGEELEYELLNYLTGMRDTFTANAWNYVSEDGYWYIACNNGASRMSMNEYKSKEKAYRMLLDSVTIDGQKVMLDGETTIHLPKGSNTIELRPEILNYSVTDPYIAYYLEGVDEDWNYVKQSEMSEIYYAGVPSGNNKFHLAIMDKAHKAMISEQIFTFEKEAALRDSIWFKIYFFAELILLIAWITWFITKSVIQRTVDLQRRELALAKNQIDMGNETIIAIARTVDAKDSNTSHHSTRVSEYSVLIAQKLGYSEEEQENLRKAALLHDIGKIGIPDKVLNKPASLTDEEYAVMKQHVVKGGEILKDFTMIPHVQEGAMYHHERYDGSGYAKGLKGDEIPEFARIIGIADAFDAMTANRVYRKKLDFNYVLSEIKNGSGKQFDPQMVDILLELIEEGKISEEELYNSELYTKGSDAE